MHLHSAEGPIFGICDHTARVEPILEQIKAVADFSEPQTVTQVRRFLGLASYYRRFIPKFAATVQPLHVNMYPFNGLTSVSLHLSQ